MFPSLRQSGENKNNSEAPAENDSLANHAMTQKSLKHRPLAE